MAALARSSRPAAGSRNSGSRTGPRVSSRAITGRAIRNTEPHQKRSSSSPPSSGPAAAPAEKLATQTPMATWRWPGSRNMLRISDRVEGARVAPADPVAEGAHGDQRPGGQEPVDVDDPQELAAGGLQIGAELGHGQVEHGQVHGVEQAGQGDHGQPDPFPPAGPAGAQGAHGRCGPAAPAATTPPSPSRMLGQPPAISSRGPGGGEPGLGMVS